MIPDLSRYAALIFDLDGTLVDSMPLHLAAWQRTAKQLQFTVDNDWLYQRGGRPSRLIAQELIELQQLPYKAEHIARSKIFHYTEDPTPRPAFADVLAVVQFYHGKLALAIGTGSPRTMAQQVLENANLSQYFTVLACADDVKEHKPAPDTFLLAAQRLGVEPAACLVLEDTGIGIEAAKAAGMDSVLVHQGKIDWQQWTNPSGLALCNK